MGVRAYLTVKIALRSFQPQPPSCGWVDARGKAIVLISKDGTAVRNGIIIITRVFVSVIVIAVGSFMLYSQIGLAFLGPLLTASALTVVAIWIGKYAAGRRKRTLEATDRRLQVMEEFLSNIRSIRFGNLQNQFLKRTTAAREAEIDAAVSYQKLDSVLAITSSFLPWR